MGSSPTASSNIGSCFEWDIVEMGHWNHRVIRRKDEEGREMLGIHEAFYDDQGKVWGITTEPVSVDGSEMEDLQETMRWMYEALDKPVLNFDDIPEEGAKDPMAGLDLSTAEPF